MAEINVKINDEVASQAGLFSEEEISRVVEKVLSELINKEKLKRAKEIASKSELTEEEADELSNKIKEQMSKGAD
ncbi:MAG: hypothetical protein ABEI74_03670 [Candidatus Pacearchaeota archaeon]